MKFLAMIIGLNRAIWAICFHLVTGGDLVILQNDPVSCPFTPFHE